MKKKVHRSIKALILAVMLTFFAGSIAVSAENIFSINFDSYTINVGDEDKLELRIENLPENKKTKWVSWNENVAVVDQEGETGVVTAVRKGKAVISSGVGFPRETCVVTVVDPSIKLNKTAATIYCAPAESGNTNEFGGKTVQLKASVKGADKAVKWSSSDTKTAVVNQNGLVTAKGRGNAVITASANGLEAKCAIAVKETDITLNTSVIRLSTKGAGSAVKLVPDVVGANKKITWKSNNTKVATVSGGRVTGKKTGITWVTASANGVQKGCLVIVEEGLVSIDEEQVRLYATGTVSDTMKYETKQLKTNAAKTDVVQWSSSDESIAVVQNGLVTAKGIGTAVITAACNGKEDTCRVEVVGTTTDIKENVVHLKTKGASRTYTVDFSVTGRKNTVKWSSSDSKVASVSKGKITAKKAGTATITAEANGVTDTVKVTVKAFEPTITLNQSEYTLYTKGKGNTVTLKAVVDGADKKPVWNSSNKNVAVVSDKGKVTIPSGKDAVAGRTLITATANGVTAKCWIRVKETKVVPEKNYYLLHTGKKDRIDVDVVGAAQSVKYKSSDAKVVAVDSKGNITGKKNGTAYIEVKANNVSAKCQVTVTDCAEHAWEPVAEADRDKDDREAACEESGLTTSVCKKCGGKQQQVIPPLGHKFGRWTVEVKATENAAGLEKQVCGRCGAENTRSIPVKNKPETADAYKLVWEDDFNGDKLDTSVWNYELHEPGWVNAELQEYVDSDKNTYVKDGKLYIQALKEVKDGKAYYTSGRINTKGKKNYQYGRFEVSAKVPSGKGFLPAFWMMPEDESYYGQWPKCGEIDVMEVHGSALSTTYGTLHFGEPHTQKQGSYTLPAGEKNFGESFHVFACEWDPGEFRFYVDDVLFYTVNDWFTQKPGFGKVAYPAPYDQPFYMILNLAVGGSWVGYPDDNDVFGENAQFVIDYVRVYQKDSYDMDVDKPENEVTLRDPDETGNYIINGDFADAEDLTQEDANWQLLLANGGDATAEISENALHITSTNAGTVNYGVQVVQASLPMENGAKYKLTYDAYADETRTMITGISAPDRGYIRYLNDTTINLTTEKQSYAHVFDMTGDSDANGRVEFNLGNQGSVAKVHISNVRLVKEGDAEKEEKGVLPDGNYVYNGQFNEGNEPGRLRLAYWDWDTRQAKGTSVSVTNDSIRELKVVVPESVSGLDKVNVYQNDIAIAGGKKYILSFDAYADRAKTIQTTVAGMTFDSELTTDKASYKYELETPADLNGSTICFLLGTPGTTFIDNVCVREDCMIVNGDFANGLLGYEVYVNDAAKVPDYIVDSLKEKDAFSMDIADTGDQDWYIQLKQSGIQLEKDKWYKLSFDAKSTVDREIMYALQRDGTSDDDWTPYSGQPKAALTSEFQRFERVFQMRYDTDANTVLSISMGAVGGKQISQKHTVVIDNISLEETQAQEEPPAETGKNLIANGDFAAGEEHWVKEVGAAAQAQVSFADEKAVFDIANVGENDWDIKLRNEELLQLEKGAKYQVQMKIKSSAARTVKYSFMNPQYAWYGGEDLELAADVLKEVDYEMTVGEDLDTSSEITFAVSMGRIAGEDTPASVIEIDDISVIKLSGDTETPEEPTETNLIKNGDFADGKEPWTDYVDNAASATAAFTGNKARYEITSAGTADWNIQLKQEGLAMEKGAKYKVNFKIASSLDRQIRLAIMGANDTWCGGTDIDLTKNKLKSFSQIMTLGDNYTEGTVAFQLSMGMPEGATALEAHAIEISDISIIKVDDGAVPDEVEDTDTEITPPAGEDKPNPEPTPSENLITNGNFADGKEPWTDYVDNAASATAAFTGNKARYEITSAGTADWNIQLKQEGLAMEKGAKYKVNFKIASSLDRQIRLAIMGANDTWCGGTDIDLTKNKLKSFSQIMTLGDNYTEGTVAFQLSMGMPEGATALEAHAIEISDISVIKVDDDAVADETADVDTEITPPAGSDEPESEPAADDNKNEEPETEVQEPDDPETTETEEPDDPEMTETEEIDESESTETAEQETRESETEEIDESGVTETDESNESETTERG